jgi:hypothetical protein
MFYRPSDYVLVLRSRLFCGTRGLIAVEISIPVVVVFLADARSQKRSSRPTRLSDDLPRSYLHICGVATISYRDHIPGT